MTVFQFKVCKADQNELPIVMETAQPTAEFKTLYAVCETEEEAVTLVSSYVSLTKYAEIEDKKIVR